MDTPFGREGSKGAKGAKGSKGEGGRLRRQFLKHLQPPWRAKENKPTALRAGKEHTPLWWLAPPPFPRKREHNNPCLM